MIRTLLVLSLAGWVLSAGPPSPMPLSAGEEQWKFVGKIMTGMSNPRQTFAGTVLDIDILINRQEDKSMEVTFSKVTSQDFNEQVYIGQPSENQLGKGSGRRPKAGGYVGDKKDVKELEGTFKAFLDRERGTVMEVPAGEQIWVTNVRKAIMNMMKVPPYTGDPLFVDLERNAFTQEKNSRAAEERISFKKRENIFAGICNVSYTMTRDANEGQWNGCPENVIPGDGEFFRLRRSVDFDSCIDVVNFQKTSTGNFSESYKGLMKEVSERSTYGEYLMKKMSDGSYQMKGILQTGDTIVRPFGQDTGRVIVHSNQTMSLQSLKRSGEQRSRGVQAGGQQSEGMKPVTTWLYQFTSPAGPDPQTEVDWVIYEKKPVDQPLYPEYAVLGGSYFQQEEIMSRVENDLETITKLQQEQMADHKKPYSGTTDGHLTNLLKVLSHSIRALNRENLKKLFDETHKNSTISERIRRQSFLDAVAVSGSAQGIRELIEGAKAKKICKVRMGGLMAQLTNSIMDPSSLKELMDYVMSPNEDSKYLEVMAHLNFAKMARRVCFDEQKKKYSVPQAFLGNRRCDSGAIETAFVSHLKNKIQSSDATWRKLMYTHALGLLGLEDTIPYLCNLATGQDPTTSPTLRMGAIYSLTHHFNRGQKREKVLRQLLPLAESHSEDFEIREIAFIAIMYMKPNATLMQRFAFHTWRDPSSQMKSLVSSTFLALAQSNAPHYREMSSMARQLMPMLQMNLPSLQNSMFFDYKDRIPDYKIGVEAKFAWASTHNSMLQAPRQVLADLKADYGGVVVPIIKVYMMLDHDLPASGLQSQRNAHNAHQKKIHQELAELSADLEIEQRQGTDEHFMYASSFNYEFFFAPSKQNIRAAGQQVKSLLERSAEKLPSPLFPDQTVKFFNPVDVVSILPTPFGTPSIVEVGMPNNWLSDYEYVVKKVQGEEYNITINGLSKMIMKSQSLMKVMMPWHNKTAVAGIDTEHSVNLPGQVSMLYGGDFPYPLLKTTISPDYRGELPLLYSRSKPLSALQPIDPTADLSSSDRIVSPAADLNAQYKTNFDVPMPLLGLKSRVTFQGDVDYPYVQSHLMPFVQHPVRLVTLLTSQTQKEYSLSYRLNIDQSETKNITLAALLVIKERQLPSHMPLDGSLEQVGQRIAEKLSIKDSLEEQLKKAKEGEFGDFTIALAVNYTTPNVRTRQYEVVLTGSNTTKTNPTEYDQTLILNIMTMGQLDKPQQNKVCMVTSIKEKLRPSGQEQGDGNEEYTVANTEVYAGKDCSDNEKVGQSELRLTLSDDDRRIEGRRPLRSGLFIGSEARAPWITDAIYNKLDMQFRWFKELPPFYQNMTNRFQDLAYGYMFPHVNRNRLVNNKGEERTIIVNVTRNIVDATVEAWIRSPEEIARIEQYSLPPIFDWATPLLGPHQPYRYHKSSDGNGRRSLQGADGRMCKLSARQVETFDGVSFEKTPTTCWTVATQVQHQQDTFAIMSRQDKSSAQSEKEVQILIPGVGKIEILKGQQLKVNGEVITGRKPLKDTSGKVIGSMDSTSNRITVSVPSKLEVVLEARTELEITLAEKYRSFMNGMCGDFNGEQAADMRSPKGCVYTPGKGPEFAASWVAKKSACEDPAMRELIEEARKSDETNCRKSLSSNSQRGQQQQHHNRQQGRRQ